MPTGYRIIHHQEAQDAFGEVEAFALDILVGLSDRVIVMRGGHIIGEIPRADCTETAVLLAANGEGKWVRT